MGRLMEHTKILRSKNAGPLFITFDLIFSCEEEIDYVLQRLKKEDVAALYGVAAEKIDIIPYRVVNAIKITVPRNHISGSIQDTDIYGCQMHVPLAEWEVRE